MNKTTRVVCLCILGAVGALCGISTISTIENQTSKIISNPLGKAYIVANVMMDDPIAIAVQDQYYVLEREELAEYNGEVAQFLNRADILTLNITEQPIPFELIDTRINASFKHDKEPQTSYLTEAKPFGELSLIEFTQKPISFHLILQPAQLEAANDLGIKIASKEFIATLSPNFTESNDASTVQISHELFSQIGQLIMSMTAQTDSSRQ